MDIYFSSDFHFGHDNIRRYCGRPFSSLEEMDTTLIRNINQRVKTDDMMFFLGDFCFSRSTEASDAPVKAFDYYRNQLLCKNIIFTKGNHDKNNSVKSPIQSLTLEYGGQRIFLTHDPMYAKPEYNINFCGHVHEKWQIRTFRQQYESVERAYMFTNSTTFMAPTDPHQLAILEKQKRNNEKFLSTHYQWRFSNSIIINVGVDQWRFMPMQFNELNSVICKYRKGI